VEHCKPCLLPVPIHRIGDRNGAPGIVSRAAIVSMVDGQLFQLSRTNSRSAPVVLNHVSCAEGGNERLMLRGFILFAVVDAILGSS
jgi:hypothetical protein